MRAQRQGHDELAALGGAFDDMADAVARQEHQLRAEREYNQLLLSSTAEAIVGVDRDGRCTFANPACLRISLREGRPAHADEVIYWSPVQRANYGLSADESIMLQRFLGCVHPDDLATIGPPCNAHDPAGDGLFDVERRIIRRDGQLRWLATRSITVFGGEGAQRRPVCTVGAVGAVGAVVDITERKLAEPALHEERNFTNAVLSNAGALVLVLDREGRIRRFNRAAEQASGRSLSPARAVNGLNMRSSSPRGMTCGHRPTPATVTSIDEDHDRAARAC